MPVTRLGGIVPVADFAQHLLDECHSRSVADPAVIVPRELLGSGWRRGKTLYELGSSVSASVAQGPYSFGRHAEVQTTFIIA